MTSKIENGPLRGLLAHRAGGHRGGSFARQLYGVARHWALRITRGPSLILSTGTLGAAHVRAATGPVHEAIAPFTGINVRLGTFIATDLALEKVAERLHELAGTRVL